MLCWLLSNIILLIFYNVIFMQLWSFTVKPQEAMAFNEIFPSLGHCGTCDAMISVLWLLSDYRRVIWVRLSTMWMIGSILLKPHT